MGTDTVAQERTQGTGNTPALTAATVDYLAVRFQETVEQVLELFGADDWSEIPHGWQGYTRGFVRGNVRVWYDGRADQGVTVQASGKGCRELEAAQVVTDWPSFLSHLTEVGAHYTRLDVALDDREGILRKDAIEAAISGGRVVSRYRFVDDRNRRSLDDGQVQGWTRYFGSEKSDTRIRIYDKALQEGIAGHWMRVELQARHEKAGELARVIVQRGLQGVAGVVRGLLEFKEWGTHSQRERWPICSWWNTFLEEASKLRLSVAPVVRTIQQVRQWFVRSVAPLASVLCAHDLGNLDFLTQAIADGQRRWKQKHRMLLSAT